LKKNNFETFRVNFNNCEKVLENYIKIAKNATGKITLQEFAGYLELPAEGAVVEVFKLYDRVKLVLHLIKNNHFV
jgi:hypothetical protein